MKGIRIFYRLSERNPMVILVCFLLILHGPSSKRKYAGSERRHNKHELNEWPYFACLRGKKVVLFHSRGVFAHEGGESHNI